ncbi:endonuclease/exonuclease/phosphatase family protein [Candidatus Woesearchaeota archaeon]|nr:endonuclease/exonuclease/phosphatase family protein [Candidatus Woesearchaeota archaeon]
MPKYLTTGLAMLASLYIALCQPAYAQSPTPSPPTPKSTTAVATPAPASGCPYTLKVGNWNLHFLGKSAGNDTGRMTAYAQHIQDANCTVLFVQEIRDKTTGKNNAFEKLCALLPNYQHMVSSRAGTSNIKEQYGFLYKPNVHVKAVVDYNTREGMPNQFERPPLEVTINVNDYNLTLINIHTDPDHVPTEMDNLEALLKNRNGNVVIIGDLNADCDYYDNASQTQFDDWLWVVLDSADTTSKTTTNCAYDRVIANPDAAKEAGIFNIDKTIPYSVSDHFLIWVELCILERF